MGKKCPQEENHALTAKTVPAYHSPSSLSPRGPAGALGGPAPIQGQSQIGGPCLTHAFSPAATGVSVPLSLSLTVSAASTWSPSLSPTPLPSGLTARAAPVPCPQGVPPPGLPAVTSAGSDTHECTQDLVPLVPAWCRGVAGNRTCCGLGLGVYTQEGVGGWGGVGRWDGHQCWTRGVSADLGPAVSVLVLGFWLEKSSEPRPEL